MYFFSARKKAASPLIVVAMVALIAASFATGFHGGIAHAASADQSAVFHGTPGTAPLLTLTQGLPTPVPDQGDAPDSDGDALSNAPQLTADAQTSAPATTGGAVDTTGTGNGANGNGLLTNFAGLADPDQAAANGGVGQHEVTPPDQGVCVGFDPGVHGQTVVFESINNALRETDVNGQALRGNPLLGNKDISGKNFFGQRVIGDPRCFFLPDTRTFLFTTIGSVESGPDLGQTSVDIAVFNAKGFAVYQIDSSAGAQFFGDQPHVGYDSNNLYITTDAFNANGPGFFGADLFAVPLQQLENEVPTLNEVFFPPVTLAGIPVRTLQPAVSTTPTQTEFLLNSFPFTATARVLSTNQLGFWTVQNGADLLSGNTQNITLSGMVIQSETYAFPVGAVSTGTGVTTNGITSEAVLNAGDSRMKQVQFIDGHLWAALETATTVGSDPVVRDGIAWFDIDAQAAAVADQGYITSAGNYLLYPAILHNNPGNTVITFSITSATLNPSAAFVVTKENHGSRTFGDIQISDLGAGAHQSFSDTLNAGARPRWGDYSAAELAPNGNDFWLATEDITSVSDPLDNWATSVFSVKGEA